MLVQADIFTSFLHLSNEPLHRHDEKALFWWFFKFSILLDYVIACASMHLLVEIHKNCIFSGAGLMGFYRIHMLDVIAVEFLIVPLILLVGGVYTFCTALFGVYATMREDSCLVTFFTVGDARMAVQLPHPTPLPTTIYRQFSIRSGVIPGLVGPS